nr:4Fe-4S binding protein [Anaerolineae bacterium]
MAMMITEECIVCSACQTECKKGGIYYDDATERYVIDAELCDGCGACTEVCPVDCIVVLAR